MRTALGVIAGIVLAFACVYLVEMLGHSIYPPPATVDYNDPDSLRAAMAQMPLGALLFVLLAWTLAVLVGGTVAGAIAAKRHRLLAGIIGGLILAGAVANLFLLPHPTWFNVAAVVLIPAASWLAAVISVRLNASRVTANSTNQ